MREPILSVPARYIASPVVVLNECRPGRVIMVDEPEHLQIISPAREWYEPIEDEL